MSPEALKQSGVPSLVQGIEQAVAQPFLANLARDKEQPGYAWFNGELLSVCSFIRDKLKVTPPELISTQGMVILENALREVLAGLEQALATKALNHYLRAQDVFDPQVYKALGVFPSLNGDLSVAEREEITRMVKRARTEVSVLNDLASNWRDRLNQVDQDLLRHAERLDDILKIRKEELDGLAASIAAARVAALEVGNDVLAKYTEEEGKRGEAHRQELIAIRNAADALFHSVRLETGAAVQEVDKQRKLAQGVVGAISSKTITYWFGRRSFLESIQFQIWRVITLGFFGVGGYVAFETFDKLLHSDNTSPNLLLAAVRLLFAITIAVPALYAAREAARHKTIADVAKQREVELATLAPFIQDLDPKAQQEIRTELTKRYFGQDVAAHTVDSPFSPDTLPKTLEALTKFAAEMKKGPQP